jgi:hypothetical protein
MSAMADRRGLCRVRLLSAIAVAERSAHGRHPVLACAPLPGRRAVEFHDLLAQMRKPGSGRTIGYQPSPLREEESHACVIHFKSAFGCGP